MGMRVVAAMAAVAAVGEVGPKNATAALQVVQSQARRAAQGWLEVP